MLIQSAQVTDGHVFMVCLYGKRSILWQKLHWNLPSSSLHLRECEQLYSVTSSFQ